MSATLAQPLRSMEGTSVDRELSMPVNTIDRELEWLSLVPQAIGRSGLTHKVAASELDIDRGQFSRQLNGSPHAHLSFRKMWKLPPEFWRELILLIAEFHGVAVGSTQQDVEDAAVGRLVREAVRRSVR